MLKFLTEKGRYVLAGIFLVGFAALAAPTVIHRDLMAGFFGNYSFYIILFSVLLWAYYVIAALMESDPSVKAFFKENARGLLFSILAAAVIFASVDLSFKTLSDETNLLSVSHSMSFGHKAYNVTLGKFYYGNFNPIDQPIPTRPLMFPFFTSVVTSAIGFHWYNPFVANFVALASLYFLLFAVARRFTDEVSAFAAVIFAASYPVISVYAVSGGFDLCSAFFFFLSFTMLYHYVSSPAPSKFAMLWTTLVVFANIRYESLLIFALVMGALVVFRYVDWNTIKRSAAPLAATPLIFLPFLWQRILTAGNTYESPPGVAPFSVGNFLEHLKEFAVSQFDFKFFLPYSNVLNFFCLGAIVYLAYLFVRGDELRSSKPQKHFVAIFAASFVTLNALYLTHFMGKYSHPTQARFFIVFAVVCAASPVLLKAARPGLFSGKTLAAFAVALFVAYHPVAVENRFISTLELYREIKGQMAFLKTVHNKNILIVYDRPGTYASMGLGACDFNFANGNRDGLLNELKRHLFTEIYVFQKIDYGTQSPLQEDKLDPEFHLETLNELQVTGGNFLRISRVKL